MVNMLFENMELLLNSMFYSFEDDFMLDFDNVFFSRMIHFRRPIHRKSRVLKPLITLQCKQTSNVIAK